MKLIKKVLAVTHLLQNGVIEEDLASKCKYGAGDLYNNNKWDAKCIILLAALLTRTQQPCFFIIFAITQT